MPIFSRPYSGIHVLPNKWVGQILISLWGLGFLGNSLISIFRDPPIPPPQEKEMIKTIFIWNYNSWVPQPHAQSQERSSWWSSRAHRRARPRICVPYYSWAQFSLRLGSVCQPLCGVHGTTGHLGECRGMHPCNRSPKRAGGSRGKSFNSLCLGV